MFSTTRSQTFAILLLATQILQAAASSPLNIVAQSYVHNLTSATPNCRGSIWCPKFNFASNRINIYLQDWIRYTMSDSDIYGPGVQIACATVSILLPPLGTNAYCAYTAGEKVPVAGINGSMIKQKIEQLRLNGCFACGNVGIADSGDPVEKGVFKIDYVPNNKVKCGKVGDVVCPPTVPSVDRGGLELGPRPVFSTFNATFEDGAITLQAFNTQDP